MMTTAAEKKEEKVEKRRALGRGLESLLPGPRVVVSPEPRVPSPETPPFATDARDGAPVVDGAGETKVPRFARDDNGGASLSPFEEVAPGEVIEIQAVADDRLIW